MIDFGQFYDLERYLFDTVSVRFKTQGCLSAFDFFCIVIWKTRRTPGQPGDRVVLSVERGRPSIEGAVRDLTAAIASLPGARERLQYLLEERSFSLAMAAALLAVLYPEEFVMYDRRLCDALGAFHGLGQMRGFDGVWDGYQAFRARLAQAAPEGLDLRGKERYLWGETFYQQITSEIMRQVEGEEVAEAPAAGAWRRQADGAPAVTVVH